MASLQNQSANTDLFDLYFRRADLDRDGRISGLEAVTFFQGSGLSKPVLAKVWDYADQNRIGFLGRAEFYNALKLVTVAQSKRELTPDIVKAALYGPASAKIPAPQINLGATPPSQPKTVSPVPQVGAPGSVPPQNPGLKGAQTPELTNQHQFSSQGSSSVTPPHAISSHPTLPIQGSTSQGLAGGGATAVSNPSGSNVSANWVAGVGGTPTSSGMTSQVQSRGGAPSSSDVFGPAVTGPKASLPPRPPGPSAAVPPRPPKDPRQVGVSGNGFASDSGFGGDPFSAIQSQGGKGSSSVSQPVASANSSVFATNQSSVPAAASLLQPSQTLLSSNQQSSSKTSQVNSFPGGVQNASQSQMPWPKITQTDVQKYSKVFVQVDSDRDGKISGPEARNLFLSWRLPREVLKQVWDLSDQDNDSMLSLREFCIALYLMERFREGCSLPATLPSSILSDLPTTNQLMAGYSNTPWRHSSGLQQQGVPNSTSRPMTPAARARPPLPTPPPPKDDMSAMSQQKTKVPVLEKHLVDQLSEEEQSSLESKFGEATEADKKVGEVEKEILESRQKIEFCRVKMQELVLYKSRCDNRLNEITERASAERREAEALGKKYEEKYRQAGDVASKLTIEEATFRDIQEKKMEVYKAIVKLEHAQGDDPNLQVQADHIQSDLDELVKNLNERCKSYGLRGKPLSLVELPFGWQPGIQETAADWDGDWDKFDEEGFAIVKELTLDVENVIAPPKSKSLPADSEKVSTAEVSDSPEADVKSEKPLTTDEPVVENGAHHSENEERTSKSGPNSPVGNSMESPSRDIPDSNVEKKTNGIASPRKTELQSSSETGGSMLSNDKGFDEPWGTFDSSENIESAWDFNPISPSKEKDKDIYQLGMDDFGLNPIKTGTSQAGFQKRSPFFDESVPSTPLFDSSSFQKRTSVFDESVPSTPLYNSNYSPSYKGESGPSFDSFSRFDSFRSNDGGLFSQRENLARFDSMRSSKDSDYGFPSFDDSDPFGSGPFKTSFESQTPRTDFDTFGNDPFKMSFDSQTPRRDFDSYGNESFKMSFDSQTPRRDFDSFGNQSFKMSFDSQTPRRDFDSFGNQSFKMSFDSQTPRRESDPFGSEPFKTSFGSDTPRSDYDSFGSGPFKTSFEGQTPTKDSDHWGTF